MKNKKFGLIVKIAFFIAFVEIIAFSFIGYINLSKYSDSLENNTKKRLSLINKMIAQEEIPISSIGRTDYMSDIIGQQFLEGFIVGNNGYIIVSSKSEYLGKSITNIPSFQKEWLFQNSGETLLSHKNKVTSIGYIENSQGVTPLYRTIITIDISSLEKSKQEILLYSLAVSILLIIISSFLLITFAQRFIIKRIDTSLKLLEKVEEGNLDVSIPIVENDEIGELQNGINAMIKKVKNLLEQYKQSLHDLKTEQEKTLQQKQELERINEKLHIQQNELNTIIENIPAMLFLKDVKELRFVRFNSAGEELTGLLEKDLIGKNDYDFFPPEQADFFMKKDKDTIESLEVIDIAEEKIDTIKGEKWLHTRKVVIKNSSDEPIYLLGISEDITERKNIEKQLKELNEELEKKVHERTKELQTLTQTLEKRVDLQVTQMREKDHLINEQSKLASMGEMIGNIAHQWRQPLSVISTGATGMIMQKQFESLSDEQFEKTCKLINDNAQYLSKTIDDFKNFIKNDRNYTKFNLKENIESFLNLVGPSFKRHNIKLVLSLDEDIKLGGYPNELIQCFMNIFNNAKDVLKDLPHHEKLFFITTIKENGKVIIKLQDNGGGVPENIIDRIFEPYFTTKHQSQGTGLGLSMTYNLISKGMKGTIVVENVNFNYEGEFYQGALFTIELPLE